MERVELIQAITPVRVGEGRAVGAVDLPVQRERQTGWPAVPGSSLKGALRERARFLGLVDDGEARRRWLDAFGREHPDGGGGEHPADLTEAGRLRFAPAVLLALPLRSVAGTFVLATSPLALARLARALGDAPPVPAPPTPEWALLHPDRLGATTVASGQARLLGIEEIVLLAEGSPDVQRWTDLLGGFFPDDRRPPLERLAVVHDEVFDFAARYWTAVRTRNAIDPETHVVEEGKLYTVETLPPETLMWTVVGRREAADDALLPDRGETWWLGGHRQVGHGRVASWWRTA